MYETDGKYGKIRSLVHLFTRPSLEAMTCMEAAGWHRCNSLYHYERPEGADTYLLLITVRGRGRAVWNGITMELTPGTVAVLPPRQPHEYFTPEGEQWEFYWIHPQGRAADKLLEGTVDRLCGPGGPLLQNAPVWDYGERIEEILSLKGAKDTAFEIQAASKISGLLYRFLLDVNGRDQTDGSRISPNIIRYMEEHYAQKLSLEELSGLQYLSRAHLIRRFKKETGYTPHEYLTRVRLSKARQLLWYEGKSVKQTAHLVGFGQCSAFIEQYRRVYGVTPGRDRPE